MLRDTSVLIDLQRTHPPRAGMDQQNARTAFSISSVSVFELSVGAERKDAVAEIRELLAAINIIAIDEPIAWQDGELFRRHHRSHGIGLVDALIAAPAMIAQLPLVTHNVKHSTMLHGLRRRY